MRREAVSAAAELSGRSFDGFPDATRSVLEALESQLPGSALFVARIDHEENELKIIDARGDESFNLSAGAVFPLDGSFCVRMVADRGPRLTGDAAAEPAYRDAAVRTELGISSYAGVPLELSDGNRVGSLCAYDHGVDRFEDDDLQLLAIMARLLANEIEREERERRLVEMNERLAELATTDSLTGLRNRGAFETALERDWQLARRGTVESFVVVADVDGLKPVNDRYRPRGRRQAAPPASPTPCAGPRARPTSSAASAATSSASSWSGATSAERRISASASTKRFVGEPIPGPSPRSRPASPGLPISPRAPRRWTRPTARCTNRSGRGPAASPASR